MPTNIQIPETYQDLLFYKKMLIRAEMQHRIYDDENSLDTLKAVRATYDELHLKLKNATEKVILMPNYTVTKRFTLRQLVNQ